MVTRSRSSVRVRSRSVARKMRSKSPRKTRSPRKMRSKSPRKMRSKSPRKTRSAKKTGSRKMSPFQKYVKEHKAQITAAVKAAGHTGKNFIKYFTKTAKKMAMEAGVKTKSASPKMRKSRKAKTASPMRRRKASALRKMKAGGLSQSAEQKLRALFSRTPTRYSLSKKGSRVVRKRRASRKAPKLTKSGKVRKTRKLSAYNVWLKQHKAQVKAEVMRRGMQGEGIKAYAKVGYEMYKASM